MRTSLKRNIAVNYAAQFYIMAAGIIMAPVYLSYMGAEAYGLVGFFSMMNAWFQLLDMGLTPTLARETARFRGGAIGLDALRNLLRALEIIFAAIAIAGACVVLVLARPIAEHWLNVKTLPIAEVVRAVTLMGLIIPLRWMSGLYRGAINGFERQVWLGSFDVLISTLRFVGVLSVFYLFGTTPTVFFTYQLCVAAFELSGLASMVYVLSRPAPGPRTRFSWGPLRSTLAFSLTIAFTAAVWVLLTQLDKLTLSKVLPLAEYGIFSISIVAANGINTLGGPFGQAILPRLAKLVAEGDADGARNLYSRATQAMCAILTPAVAALCFFAEPIIHAWTGNAAIAHSAAPILRLYAAGNGLVAVCTLPYFLQYAKGELQLHFIGHALELVLLVPLIIWSAIHYGAIGTGWSWVIANALYALLWLPVIHRSILKGGHWRWLVHDIGVTALPTILAAWLLSRFIAWPNDRWAEFLILAALGGTLLMIGTACSAFGRELVARRFLIWNNRYSTERS